MSLRKVAAIAAALLTLTTVNVSPAYAGGSAQDRRAAVADRAGVSAALLDGPWHIVNRHSGKCLAVNWASHDERAWVVQHTCEYSAPYNEEWYFDGAHIVNGHTGKCLSINFASHDERAWAVQYTCEDSAPYNENWTREQLGNGYSLRQRQQRQVPGDQLGQPRRTGVGGPAHLRVLLAVQRGVARHLLTGGLSRRSWTTCRPAIRRSSCGTRRRRRGRPRS